RGLVDFGSTVREALGGPARHVWMQPGPYRRPRRILVPIDLSDASVGALRTAVRIAGRLEAAVTALHCFESPELYAEPEAGSPIGFPTYVVDDLRDKQRAELATVVAAVDWKGVAHEAQFVEGNPRSEVLERQEGHDLIVLSTHGRTGLRRLLLGNVAYEVMRQATVPVLAVRPA
ncbi:MAG TPA: universal stress protein, partial [Planctomycetota bacterium]|nr:universal stress protein [Planctomycetota bacterium]